MTTISFTPEDDPERVTAMFDPYSAWSLRYALDFDLTATEDRDDPHDFRYMFTVDTMQAGDIEDLPEPFRVEGETDVVLLTRSVNIDGGVESAQATFQSIAPFDPAQNRFSKLAPAEGGEKRLADAPPPDERAELAAAEAEEAEDQAQPGSRDTLHFRAPLRKISLPTGATRTMEYTAQDLPEATTTIVGVIDDGINPLHSAFRGSTGTRVDFAWVQDAAAPSGSTTVPFGRELTKAEIDAQLALAPKPEIDQLHALGLADYARAGVNTVAHRLSHGTHVASLAAGDGPDHLRLLTVQLPATVTMNTSGAFMSPFVLAGAAHILDRAWLMSLAEGFPIPVVINFSYSLSGGPHNGLHFLERAIDTLVQAHLERLARQFPTKPGRAEVEVVLPSGNRLAARGHAEKPGDPAGPSVKTVLTLPWRVQPGDESSNFLELWMPRTAAGVELWLTPPGGTATRVTGLSASQAVVIHPAGNPAAVIGRISLDRQKGQEALDGVARKKRVLIALAPSCMPPSVGRRPAPSGLWTVELRARITDEQRIEAWIQRDDAPLGYRRPGRQSYFDDPAYPRWDAMTGPADYDNGASVVLRSGSLNGIATGRRSTVVGPTVTRAPHLSSGFPPAGDAPGAPGYERIGLAPERAAALYGASAAPHMRRPDASAEGDRSLVMQGVLGAGAASGSRMPMNGSSVAAPQYTRFLADGYLGLAPPGPALWPAANEAEHQARLGARALPPQSSGVAVHR
ncbi:S8 family serine peptidase [Vannielia litorea]|uniref:S8 family serine peptidase n=1 Tax=Vannielia litorea TaxID=1217970 RepID=UPI001C9494F1|nr:S8 family serine peptidase [Vannielia litorea]MBY6047930.1 S8 family serine peptidase [Vannielia litorea]MBY6075344.1 S8 family serine peptidase [Vannielia litorea]